MGSETGSGSMEAQPGTPTPAPPDASHARARRSLAASAAARTGIATMVDSLRISKPPRAPANPRRHALIPLAEGRHELEARIHALEDLIAARDEDATKLKRQLGRALVRRRHLERERDSAVSKLTPVTAAVKECYAGLVAARADLATLVEDIQGPLQALKRGLDASAFPPLEDIAAAIDIAREKLARPPTKPEVDALPAASIALGKTRPTRLSFTGGSDDDAKSCASYASSNALGEDREIQIEALTDLIEVLSAKISAGHPSEAVLDRARQTIAREERDVDSVIAERDRLREALDSVMDNREGSGAARAAQVMAEAELRQARVKMESMRQRLAAVERIAERAVKSDEIVTRNSSLEAELVSAKKTVARLVQERNSLRKSATATNTPNSTYTMKILDGGTSEAMKRILDWRQRASGENRPPPQPNFDEEDPVPFENGQPAADFDNKLGSIDRTERLPDRITSSVSRKAPAMKRALNQCETNSVNTNENISIADSLDVGANDSASAHSVPVRGFLRRHDSFLSAGDVSASGDEITIPNNRNVFISRRPYADGLLGLLG